VQVTVAQNAAAALNIVSQHPPDVFLIGILDFTFKRSLEAFKADFVHTKLILLVMNSMNEEEIEASKGLGVAGIVQLSSNAKVLFECIRSVIDGQIWIDPSLCVKSIAFSPPEVRDDEILFPLTKNEGGSSPLAAACVTARPFKNPLVS